MHLPCLYWFGVNMCLGWVNDMCMGTMFNGGHNCLNFKKCYLRVKCFLFRVVRTLAGMSGSIRVAPKLLFPVVQFFFGLITVGKVGPWIISSTRINAVCVQRGDQKK